MGTTHTLRKPVASRHALAQKKKVMGFGHRVYKKQDSRAPTMDKFGRMLAKAKGALGAALGTVSLAGGATALSFNADGTFTYTAPSGSCGGTFTFLINGSDEDAATPIKIVLKRVPPKRPATPARTAPAPTPASSSSAPIAPEKN